MPSFYELFSRKQSKSYVGRIYYYDVPNQENHDEYTNRPIIVFGESEDTLKCISCPITKQLHQKDNYPFSFIIHKDSIDGKLMKLKCDSLLMIDRILEIKKSDIDLSLQTRGFASEDVIEKINTEYNKFLKSQCR